jgi:RNA polymerase sigma-70 factor (ECF subfamily)
MDDRPDERLVEEARGGAREAFAELVRRHERRVYAVALRLAGDRADADDLAQEVFLTAWKSVGSFRSGSSFYTWLYRITVNTSLTFLKKRKRERNRAPFDENLSVGAHGRDPAGGPEATSSMSELSGRIGQAMAGLPAHFRATFALVVDQGLSHADAAAVLGCSENTVSWRMHKARRLLQARLKPYLAGVIHESSRPQMRGPRGEAVLFGTANPENEADEAGSVRPEGKNARKKEMEKKRAFL